MTSSTSRSKLKMKVEAIKGKCIPIFNSTTPPSSKDSEESVFCPGYDEKFQEPIGSLVVMG
jgi:hypothetical protein